jgi:hypothetical protein
MSFSNDRFYAFKHFCLVNTRAALGTSTLKNIQHDWSIFLRQADLHRPILEYPAAGALTVFDTAQACHILSRTKTKVSQVSLKNESFCCFKEKEKSLRQVERSNSAKSLRMKAQEFGGNSGAIVCVGSIGCQISSIL